MNNDEFSDNEAIGCECSNKLFKTKKELIDYLNDE
jgi:hypothetical protein